MPQIWTRFGKIGKVGTLGKQMEGNPSVAKRRGIKRLAENVKPNRTITPDEFHVSTLGSVQRFFGISRPTVKEWKNQGMPSAHGSYDLREIFKWWLSSGKFRHAAAAVMQKKGSSLDDEKLAIEIELKRLKLQREAGELVSRVAALATVESMFHRIRARLEAIPDELGASLPVNTRAVFIDDTKTKIRLILREMENWSMDRSVK